MSAPAIGDKRYALVLAAGRSTRFKSPIPKVVHPLRGRPLLVHILEKIQSLDLEKTLVVVGHGDAMVKDTVADYGVEFVVQEEPLGTGHAVMSASPLLKKLSGSLLVISGDTPMVRIQTLERLFEARKKHHADEIVLTGAYEDPQGYGRIIRDHKGEAVDIIEEKDATADQKEIREVNTGIACFKIDTLLQGLSHLSRNNAAGEYYLTDLVRIFCGLGHTVRTLQSSYPDETLGINSLEELAQAEEKMREEEDRRQK
ncbi:MAG: NTP transferase domain-containing protein [Acidobacteriota bacterium]|nr:NTP transferase domain-containing protein [Acidobacteriota bacterium]